MFYRSSLAIVKEKPLFKLCFGLTSLTAAGMATSSPKKAANIYVFEAKDIDGNMVSLDKYKGHVCVIVNVASKWGLTDLNYRQLQELNEKYSADGLRILGFPCNQVV